jgi:16S rRNA (cytidine1402-2'-O)-methyltransferase
MAQQKKGNLYLIPCTIGDNAPSEVIPSYVLSLIPLVKHFVVENERTARRFLKKVDNHINIDELSFLTIEKHGHQDYTQIIQLLNIGMDVGLLSEAGCPAVADPGSELVHLAQKNNIIVRPLVGPSSILLALMGSGFNGQSFVFHGYIPIKHPDRLKFIKQMEGDAKRKYQTQIFIETPFRNQKLLQELLEVCLPDTRLCIATEITTHQEKINTKTIHEWQKHVPDINKKNCVMLIG